MSECRRKLLRQRAKTFNFYEAYLRPPTSYDEIARQLEENLHRTLRRPILYNVQLPAGLARNYLQATEPRADFSGIEQQVLDWITNGVSTN